MIAAPATSTPVTPRNTKATWFLGATALLNLAITGFILTTTHQAENAKESLAQLASEREKRTNEIRKINEELILLQAKNEQALQIKSETQVQLKQIESERNAAQNTITQFQSLKELIKSLETQRDKLSETQKKQSDKIAAAESEIDSIRLKIEIARKELQSSEKALATLTEKRELAASEVANIETKKRELLDSESRTRQAQIRFTELKNKEASTQGIIDQLQEQRTQLEKAVASLETQQRALIDRRAEFSAKETQLAQLATREATLSANITTLTSQRDALLKETSDAESQLRSLESNRAAIVAMLSQSDALSLRQSTLQGSVDKLTQHRDTLAKEIGAMEALKQQQLETQTAIASAKGKIDNLNNLQASLQSSIDKLTTQQRILTKETSDLENSRLQLIAIQAKAASAQVQADDASTRAASLRGTVEQLTRQRDALAKEIGTLQTNTPAPNP